MDMADAMHPQTFLAYGMNGNDLPVGNGGPLRIRLPRQLGYKSVKFLNRLIVTDDVKNSAWAWAPFLRSKAMPGTQASNWSRHTFSMYAGMHEK